MAAGLRHDSDVSVFVHGLLQPLDFGQRIRLVTGMMISYVPGGSGAPATFDIATRLQSSEGWDTSPSMPGPGYFPGKTFWVLTDGLPVRFTLGYRQEPCFHAALCEHLGSDEHRLSAIRVHPEITDAFPKGHWTTSVVVATEQISSVPYPPARAPNTGVALVLDCRPLLLGIRWLLLHSAFIPVSEVVQPFQELCPHEYMVTVSGCSAVQRDNDMVFPIQSQVLVISFTEDLQSSDQTDGPPNVPPDDPHDTQGPDGDYDTIAPDSPGNEGMSPGPNTCDAGTRHRSRSPRGGGQHGPSVLVATGRSSSDSDFEGLVYKWGSASHSDALAEGMPSPTSVLTFAAARFRLVIPDAISTTFAALYGMSFQSHLYIGTPDMHSVVHVGGGCCPSDRLLPSEVPDHSRAFRAYEAARLATIGLGFPWPRPTLEPTPPFFLDDGSEEAEASDEITLVDVTFLVLAPEYCPESVTMQIAVPQTVGEAIELLDLCRPSTGREMFPQLYPVHPQPDVRWGLAVAAPSWPTARVIVCLDLTLLDGRIFAAAAPPELDKHILLNMAGLSGAALVDVYLAELAAPVEYGAELLVANGDCISFVPANAPLELRCPLQTMLRSHLGWAEGPAFPQAASDDRFCAVSAGFYCDFLLLPERAAFYRADLASRFQVPINLLCLQPAAPRQEDVTVYGRHCRTVICVGSSHRRDDDQVGLLDCRPVLEGWTKVLTVDRWLDVGSLRQHFQLSAPAGHLVDFSGCCRHWNWLWLEPGQVVVVSYTLDDNQPFDARANHNAIPPETGEGPPDDGFGPGPSEHPHNDGSGQHHQSSAAARFPTRDSPDDVETSSIVSCQAYSGPAIDAYDLTMWLKWFLDHACFPGTIWITSALVTVLFGAAYIALHFRPRAADRLLVAWLCLSLLLQTGPTTAEAVQLGTPPGHTGIEIKHGGGRPLPTPCRCPRVTAVPLADAQDSLMIPGPYPNSTHQGPNSSHCISWCIDVSDSIIPDVDLSADIGPIQTLLEDSLCSGDCPAMFLAFTLVEALMEHFGPQAATVNGAPQCKSQEVQPVCTQLALNTLLPVQNNHLGCCWPLPLQCRPFYLPMVEPPFDQENPLHIAGLNLGFSLNEARVFLNADSSLVDVPTMIDWCLSSDMWQPSMLNAAIIGLRVSCKPGELFCYTDGSYTPGSSDKDPLCGWACVFIDPHAHRLSAAYGSCPYAVCPLDSPSAYLGECAGLLAAALISTVALQGHVVHFLSDCTSALAAASGTASYALGGLAQTCNSAFCLRRATGHLGDTHCYVPGHSNCFGNDLADALSKYGAKGLKPGCGITISDELAQFWLGTGGTCLPWLGLVIRRLAGDLSLPPLNTSCLGHDRWHGGLSPQQLLEPFLPPAILTDSPPADPSEYAFARLQLKLATFNTLSLHSREAGETHAGDQDTGLAFCPGRAQMLADQLHSHGVHAACLQETRCETGFLRTGGFIRFCSGADKGQWGTEWWFRDGHSFAVDAQSGHPLSRFHEHLFTVLYKDPRRLILRLGCGYFKVVFIGLHAPHRATERTILEEWWHNTHALARTHARQDPVVLAGDMNAALGSIQSTWVGPHGAETEDVPGEALHSVLHEFGILMPATWEHIHQGPHHTYVQKRGSKLCRPDFIGVPMPWVASDGRSILAPDINAGHSCPDHIAATFHTNALCGRMKPQPRAVSRRFKPCDLTDSCVARVEAAINAFPAPSWNVSAHAHAAALVATVQQALKAGIPKKQSRPYKTYLQEDTWALQQQVAAVRRSLHRLQHRTSLHLLAIYFHCWRQRPDDTHRGSTAWIKRADLSMAAHLGTLRELGAQLKKACRRDRDAYVAQLADKLAQCPTQEVFQSLHALLGHRRRKKYQVDPLPAITHMDGSMCQDRADTMGRWREHFGGMEGGYEVSVTDLIAKWDARIQHGVDDCPWPLPPQLADVPTEADLRRLLAGAKAGKSPGMDGIPVEVGKRLASSLAPHLHRLALKTAFRGVEPCGFKAGQTIWFYKGKGPHTSCSSFRAILLLPVWSKIVHQALRPPMKCHFESNAPAFQIGGRSRCTAVFGCHLVRSACRVAVAAGHSHFTLFADIASAYYCVIQQLVAKWVGRGKRSSLTDGMHMSPGETFSDEVAAHLCQPSAMCAGGASTWLEALTDCFQSDNFFLLRGDDTAVMTSKGSRPGSSWADLIFAALVRRILERRNQLRSERDELSSPLTLPYDGRKCLDPSPGDAAKVSVSEVVWADDLAIPRLTDPYRAAKALGFEASILTDAFKEFGFSLTFGPHKTAGLLTLRGLGSRKARQSIFGPQGLRGLIPVLLDAQPSVSLPLVGCYRHLGCQQGPAGNLKSEIQYRVAQARATFSEARRKVYKNPHVSTQRKGLILGATVIPKLVYGAGAWGPLTAGEMRTFSGALWSFYRPLLGIKRWDDQRIDASTCFALLGLPSPTTLLRTQRLLYLGQMLRAGPAELWAVLRADRPHASLLQADVRWMHAWTWSTTGLPCPDTHWDDWESFVSDHYGKFKGAVKRARALDICRYTVIAALSGLHRALLQVCGTAEPPAIPRPAQYTEVCIPCKRAFADRLSWAGHAARKHGYRSHAYLCAQGTTCMACGKRFSSTGRLRRHLYAKEQCIHMWGSFQPASSLPSDSGMHLQAPPQPMSGTFDLTASTGVCTDVAGGLLQDLISCNSAEEDEVWDIVISYVEPLAVLRATVMAWASHDVTDQVRRATADNILLLLDVELLADCVQPKCTTRAFPQDTLPVWADPGQAPFVMTGEVATFQLLPPPPVYLDFAGPVSMRLRDAVAYSTWLADGCDTIARLIDVSRTRPVTMACPSLDSALGPASCWLKAAGFYLDSRGLTSPRD